MRPQPLDIMRPEECDQDAYSPFSEQANINNNERELLRRIWIEADSRSTVFVSIDTEFVSHMQQATELGIATRQKHSLVTARHIVVNGKQPKPFSFGASESVQRGSDLLPFLVQTFARLQADHELVVLTGHDIPNDIHVLEKTCGWMVPDSVIIIDTLRIWRSWINIPNHGNLKDALSFFAIEANKGEMHNAGNDAWYTLDLLVHKANQAVACPIRMTRAARDQAQLMPAFSPGQSRALKKAARATLTPLRHTKKATLSGSATQPTRAQQKHKREDSPTPDQAFRGQKRRRRNSSSPPIPVHRLVSRPNKPLRTAASWYGTAGAGGQVPPANIGIIDLTDETPSAEKWAGRSCGMIDLTEDTPSLPKRARQDQGYSLPMDGQDDAEPMQMQRDMGHGATQEVGDRVETGLVAKEEVDVPVDTLMDEGGEDADVQADVVGNDSGKDVGASAEVDNYAPGMAGDLLVPGTSGSQASTDVIGSGLRR